ncbi:type II secretion system F family protein [Virgibacillus kekensis]|uniref:Type II secretion system F family protein n=1 Tax=Virgibacillus kekensis TaxID=202261 RepID=A0ABV9DLV3_9BACI
MKNGYPLVDALEIIKWDSQLEQISAAVINSLKSSDTLDEALEKERFNSTITSYLYFVRANGDIQLSIAKCILMYEQRIYFMKKLQDTTRYPAILFIIFVAMLYLVKQLVLPSFADIFLLSNGTTSAVTLAVSFIDFFGILAAILIFLFIILVLTWQLYKRNFPIENRISVYRLIPIYYKYKRMQTSQLFASHVSSLLKTGMSIKEILHIMADQRKQPILSYYATLLESELSRGFFINNLLAELPMFDKQLSVIFHRNTDVEALEKDLVVYTELITDEMHRRIAKLITWIQPIFFIVLAGFIVFIYAALMWPMFELINTI